MPGEAQAVQAGLQFAAGTAQFFDAIGKEKRAKAELKRLKPAFYKIQDEYTQNRNIAAEMAGGGLPAASLDYRTTESQRGLGASISGILQGGGDSSSITKMFDVYDRSIDRTGAANAEQHLKNQMYFMGVNKDLAGQKTMQWALNEYQPYQNKLKEITQRRAAAEQNKWGGIQTAIGSAGAYVTSQQNNDLNNPSGSLINQLFANQPTQAGYNLPLTGAPMGIDPLTGLPPVNTPYPQPFGNSPLNPFP